MTAQLIVVTAQLNVVPNEVRDLRFMLLDEEQVPPSRTELPVGTTESSVVASDDADDAEVVAGTTYLASGEASDPPDGKTVASETGAERAVRAAIASGVSGITS